MKKPGTKDDKKADTMKKKPMEDKGNPFGKKGKMAPPFGKKK